ncbi:GNAT family N-acetyltransferase [Streptococcus cristatus]|uniref:GNAT family N-acetyltransferase n=1 Tax=Streptococcus cristatus TaxID=45634 RepID=UPI0039C48373
MAYLDFSCNDLTNVSCSLRILLWVLEDNKRAIAFYEKMGFVFDDEEKVIDLGKAVKEKQMIYSKNFNS